MNSKDWHSYKLKDLCTKIGSGSTPRGGSGVYLESGTTFIRSQNIYNNYFEYNGLVFIDDDASHKLRSVEVERDDVLLNITGDSVARCTIVPKKLLPARVNQHVCILRADKSKLDPFYLQYFFVNPRMQQEMLSLAYSGGTRAALTKAMIENFNITLPNIKEQKEISKILSALDSKIEINNKINKNLEEMAQAIFKQWFIDFEFPNEEGKPYKSSGGEMVESELGMIPKTWEIDNLKDLFNFQEGPGIRNWQYVNSDGINFINIKCIKNNDLELGTANMISKEEAEGKYSHFLLDEWDIVMSCSGTLGRYAIVRKDHLPLCLNTSVIRFKAKKSKDYYSFMYGYLSSRIFYEHLITMACGSVQANFGPTHLNKIRLISPSEDIIRKYHQYIFKIIKQIITLRTENDRLKKLRDTLLPKLMSGEIRVNID